LAFHSGREADHSPPSSVEVKNGWSCTSTSPVRLHGVVLRGSIRTTLPLFFGNIRGLSCFLLPKIQNKHGLLYISSSVFKIFSEVLRLNI
jgi:hypothetical protein